MNCDDILKLEGVVEDMEIIDKVKSDCGVCLENKSTKYAFKRKTIYPNEKDQSLVAGEIISTDVGFVDGKPYVCFTDHYSDCTYTAFMSRKGETLKN